MVRLYIQPKHGSDLQKGLKKAAAHAREDQKTFNVGGLTLQRDVFGFYIEQDAREAVVLPAKGFHIKEARLRRVILNDDVTKYHPADGFYKVGPDHAMVTTVFVYGDDHVAGQKPDERTTIMVVTKEAKRAMQLYKRICSGELQPESPFVTIN